MRDFVLTSRDDPEVKGTVWVRMVPKRFAADNLGYRV